MSKENRSSSNIDPLLRRAFSGSRGAQSELALRYEPLLRRFIGSQLGSRMRARNSVSDLSQETFTQVFKATLESLPDDANLEVFESLLKRHAIWVILNRVKELDRLPQLLDSSEVMAALDRGVHGRRPTGPVTSGDDLRWVLELVEHLDEKYRVVIQMYVNGASYKEIAQALGLRVDNVRKRIQRSIDRLKAEVEARTSSRVGKR